MKRISSVVCAALISALAIASAFAAESGGGAGSAAESPPPYEASPPPPPPAAAIYSESESVLGPWTGFYVGGQLGGAFDANKLSFVDLSAAQDLSFRTNNGSSFIGGVRAGYDWQAGNILIGVLGDVNFADHIDYLATARGRIGFPMGRFLVYGTGGAAFEGADERFTAVSATNGPFAFKRSLDKTGWTFGGGLDYMIAPNLSLGAEGLYYDLGRDTALLTAAGGEPFRVRDDRAFGVAQATLTYHFGVW